MGEHTGRTPSAAGTLIAGRYELVAPLGSGGMAQVWSAQDRLLSRRVAVKILHRHLTEDPSFVQRFRREAVSAARLVHPNIVAVYDTVSVDGFEAIVMELVDGITLRDHLDRSGRMSEARVREIGRDLAGALDCAHRNGVVHRDIKPANILITDDGSVRLADFGIAKAEEDPDLTVAGTLVGTAAYLAPEQVGGGVIDQRTDLYSLSTVLYEALSGTTPFRGDSPAATALARLHQDPADLASRTSGVSSRFCKVIMRNLERAPERRFQSALDFGAALATTGSGGSRSRHRVPATSGDAPPPAPPPATGGAAARRRRSRSERRLSRSGRSVAGRVIMAILVTGPVVLIATLLLQPSSVASPTKPTDDVEVRSLTVVDATSFDPGGDNGVENEADAADAIDGDPATRWRTEGYNSQTFDTKPGVGLVLDLAADEPLDTLRLTGSVGWKGSVYVLGESPVGTAGPPATGAIPVDATSSPLDVPLDGAVGRYLLIWITDLGPKPAGEDRHRVSLDELTLTGRVRTGG